jgi:hypothetical protein
LSSCFKPFEINKLPRTLALRRTRFSLVVFLSSGFQISSVTTIITRVHHTLNNIKEEHPPVFLK